MSPAHGLLPSLRHTFTWRGRHVRWNTYGQGPPVVFCHGTPWSSYLWHPFAVALSENYRVYEWDMPGYGQSSKQPDHDVGLDFQGELFAALLGEWNVDAPHVIAHDYGGAVSLRAHLLRDCAFVSFALSTWLSEVTTSIR
ncbi:alpha/beta fold hydrolase [Natronoglycomyces albus]|uniref:Alpha/beta fold hydrolase n=1 Tax=Natronoglycomyces albus TaxID=2811108 RepID=A0A895XY40_9ACTN|nr:alpha/beta fold hydrolase [Natronoglycomyces albus]QSB06538.1 alpha/beta fold hydrolase [Natronoglycomyces albus]